MKRTLLFICLTVSANLLYAQDSLKLVSKKGEKYLPEAKDWALGIDAVPFLEYTGRLLSTAGSNSPAVNAPSSFPLTITGKYFITDKKCYRGKVRIAAMSSTTRNSVVDEANSTTDTVYTQDVLRSSSTDVTLSIGIEKRRGKTRLQGLYGIEGLIIFDSGKSKVNYGNDYSSTHISVTSTDFYAPPANGVYSSTSTLTRITEKKQGTTVGVGARGFVGVEYFIFPKISLAAELGWGFAFKNTNDGYSTQQSWDIANNSSKSKRLINGGSNQFGVDTDNNGGQLSINFHF
jgi:hypothetical protein